MNSTVAYDEIVEAEGSIEPKSYQFERLDEFMERIMDGEFHVSTEDSIVYGCIDGRPGATVKPNSAGGSESLMVADDLINKQFAGNDKSTRAAYANIIGFLKKNGKPVGGHDDDYAEGDKSGCGANDRLADIYGILVRKSDTIRSFCERYGITVDDETHAIILKNAGARQSFSDGSELKAELDLITRGEYDRVYGSHNEVAVVLNTVSGTTLDRDLVYKEFGEELQAFNVDVWAFQESVNIISTTPNSREVQQKVVAMAYYNFATALTLCGPAMRIVVR